MPPSNTIKYTELRMAKTNKNEKKVEKHKIKPFLHASIIILCRFEIFAVYILSTIRKFFLASFVKKKALLCPLC